MPFDPSKRSQEFSSYANPYAPRENVSSKKKGGSKFIIVLLILVLLLGMGIGFFIYIKTNLNKGADTDNPAVPQAGENSYIELEIFDIGS